MRAVKYIFFVALLISNISEVTAFSLTDINKEWKSRGELLILNKYYRPISEQQAVQAHLMLVEYFLRKDNTDHLTNIQKANRAKYLDYLHEYWNQQQFPINNITSYRTPVFIDEYNNFCAVGYLMKRSGREDIAQAIKRENNLIFVKDIKNQQALKWIRESGLSADDCAWIQPTYANPTSFNKCGKGTNGNVYELRNIDNELYVGGYFSDVDSAITSYGIAKLIKAGNEYKWIDISNGLPTFYHNGKYHPAISIRAIEYYDSKIWITGLHKDADYNVDFETTYYYDGSKWTKCAGIFGKGYDFEIYNGKLYMSGAFNEGSIFSRFPLAHWDINTQTWIPDDCINLSYSIIFKMTLFDNKLVLAGHGIRQQNCNNILTYDGLDTYPLYTGLENNIYALAVHSGKLYAAGELNGASSSYTMKYYNGHNWIDTNQLFLTYSKTINVLKSVSGRLFWGGNFIYPGMMYSCKNLMCTDGVDGWGELDTTVNAIEEFDGNLFVAGNFTKQYFSTGYNHITYIDNLPKIVPVEEPATEIVLYPNPSSSKVTVKNVAPNCSFEIYNFSGIKVMASELINGEAYIQSLSNGMYILKIKQFEKTSTNFKLIKI